MIMCLLKFTFFDSTNRWFPRIAYFALYSRMRTYHVDVIKLKGEIVRQRAFVKET